MICLAGAARAIVNDLTNSPENIAVNPGGAVVSAWSGKIDDMSVQADEERVRALRERYPDEDLDAIDITIALGRAATSIERLLAQRLKPHKVTPVGMQVLISVLLADGGPIDLKTLGADVRVTKANVSLVLRALEREGLVTREAEPADGRRLRVKLTRKGKRLVQELVPLVREAMEEGLAPLSKRDRNELRRITRRIDLDV